MPSKTDSKDIPEEKRAAPQEPPPKGEMGCFSLGVIIGILIVLSAINIFSLGLIVTTAAAALLIIAVCVSKIAGLSRRTYQAMLSCIVVFMVAAIPLYYAYEAACGWLYIIPSKEYDYSKEESVQHMRQWLNHPIDETDPETMRVKRIRDEIILRQFNETPPVSLDEPSTLTFKRDFPRLDGATSLAGIYRSFARTVYPPDVYESHAQCSRTPFAYEKLINGEVDMIFVFHPSERQIAAAAEKGLEFTITPIGYEAFVFFVNAGNPVGGLTVEQLRGIYGGKIADWSEVGGKSGAIIPFQRPEGSGSQSRMERFMAGETMVPARKETLFRFMGDVVQAARYHNYRNAIGFSFYYFVDVMMEGGGVKLLDVDGVPPRLDTIRDGRYPLTDEICVVTAGTDNPHAQAFIDWMLSPQGQRIVELAGYTSLRGGSKEEKPAGRGW